MAKNNRNPNLPAWMTQKPFVGLPIFFLKSDAWMDISATAAYLYLEMRASYWNGEARANLDISEISFGPADSRLYKRSYYNAIENLISHGFIKLKSKGRNGKKAVYDLSVTDWMYS